MEDSYDKFHYALQLAFLFPSVDIDEYGNWEERPHYSFTSFVAFHEKQIVEMGLSEEAFYKQESVIPVIEAYGLNKEQFWYAVAYVKVLTNMWIVHKGLDPLPSPVEQLIKMRDEISGQPEFRIIIDDGLKSHSFMMAGHCLIGFLTNSLDDLIAQLKNTDWNTNNEVPVWRQNNYKKTEATWYAANLFKKLFECLKLPTIRSRNNNGITFDKNQLIAELIHFLKLTDNPNLDGYSIKGILDSKRKFSFGIL